MRVDRQLFKTLFEKEFKPLLMIRDLYKCLIHNPFLKWEFYYIFQTRFKTFDFIVRLCTLVT